MKVIFSHIIPFSLGDGGVRTLVTSIQNELLAIGINVENEKWWDTEQKGDILHFFGRPQSSHILFAKRAGYKTVMTEFLDMTSNRSPSTLFFQKSAIKLARSLMSGMTDRMGWDTYQNADALIYTTSNELNTAAYLFGADTKRGHIVPHGLQDEAINNLTQPAEEKEHLVSIATITERKQTLLLAKAARLAQVPIVFLGKPYSEDDLYFKEFKECIDNQYVKYPGFVSEKEKADMLRTARGFALMSKYESGCIAVYEAAAAGLPMLLPNKPWVMKDYAAINNVSVTGTNSVQEIASSLKKFYSNAHRSETMTFPVQSWRNVAEKYADIYKEIMET
ncbi:hypothetical protein BVX97_05980 [bacterium E08(2017)]|nr:hypothetical protein BVX97_05980 [bacterium E08(2017)]